MRYSSFVALLAEGVDRNSSQGGGYSSAARSPSSRRAWIEMSPRAVFYTPVAVALLAEGVDRNSSAGTLQQLSKVALLAEGVDRNAVERFCFGCIGVALLAEGVDRNILEKF